MSEVNIIEVLGKTFALADHLNNLSIVKLEIETPKSMIVDTYRSWIKACVILNSKVPTEKYTGMICDILNVGLDNHLKGKDVLTPFDIWKLWEHYYMESKKLRGESK